MNFRTIVNIKPSERQIDHSHALVFIGSCFAENIGEKFKNALFTADINPFGVLYNPLSIASALRRLMSGKLYEEKDLFFDGEMWHSAAHHSSFSDKNNAVCLQKINDRLTESSENLRRARHLFITFGTAWVYEWKNSGQIVGNCHKLPAKSFTRRRLNVDEIVDEYDDLLRELQKFNPNLNIVFTVSPIRHRKDGAHENSLSKSALLLAIDRLTSLNLPSGGDLQSSKNSGAGKVPFEGGFRGAAYFPAYEIVNDDLRDYRFYAPDMIHLSDVAVDYIWERVGEAFFSMKTRKIVDEVNEINKAKQHRPFNPESEKYRDFLKKMTEKEYELIAKNNIPDFRLFV